MSNRGFSQLRHRHQVSIRYRPETGQAIYYGRQRGRCGDDNPSPARICAALDFLAAWCTQIPDPGQQSIRFRGAFSNVRLARARATAV
jgi:hypothetical protein